jgi:hypothetical protein
MTIYAPLLIQRQLSFVVCLAGLVACSSSKQAPASPGKVHVAEAMAGTTTVELLTDTQLETGLTPIYLRLSDSGGSADDITFSPLMTMSSDMQHGCPVIGKPMLGVDGLYRTAAVFQMATSDMGSWSATVRLGDSDAGDRTALFDSLNVVDTGRAKTFSTTDSTGATEHKYVASLNFVAAPTVGLNPVVLTVHEMQDMFTFAPIEDATITLDPQMPSMGHGSPGSENPTPTTLGQYSGKVSLSMSGTWEITANIARAGAVIGAPKFSIMF